MASQKNNVFAGMVGNIIFYEMNGKQYARSRPRKFKQSKATKAVSKLFGEASRLSSQLRSGLWKLLPDTNEKEMRYRFDKAIQQWLRNGNPDTSSGTTGFSFIDGFQFSNKASLTEKLKLLLPIDWSQQGKIIINMPKLVPSHDIAAPANTETVHWMIEVVSSTVKERSSLTAQYGTTLDMKYTEKAIPAQKMELSFKVKPQELIIVVLALKYTVKKYGNASLLNNESWLPAGIIGSYFKASE
jgi:hypothetical protein